MCNGSPRRKKEYGGTEEISEERITKNFPNFMVDTNPEGQETQRKKNKAKKYIKSFYLQTAKNKRENLKGKQRDKHITGR